MSFTKRNLKQVITIFSVTGVDVYGTPTYSPRASKGRWEDSQVKFVDDLGIESLSTAVVFLIEDVELGNYLLLGASTSTTLPAAAREVKSFSKIPDIRFKTFLRKAILR